MGALLLLCVIRRKRESKSERGRGRKMERWRARELWIAVSIVCRRMAHTVIERRTIQTPHVSQERLCLSSLEIYLTPADPQ